MKLAQDAIISHNRKSVYPTKEIQEKLWETFEKKIKLNDEGM